MTLPEMLMQTFSNPMMGLHLNISRYNGQILAQIYNVQDFDSWEVGISFGLKDGIVISLNFAKGKTNNEASKKRFLESLQFNDFTRLEVKNRDQYYAVITDRNSLDSYVSGLLLEVYEDGHQFICDLVTYRKS